jgi:hypothetical protein
MIYFGYPLDIHMWKTKPDIKLKTKTENRGWKTIPKPETAGPKTRGYPTRTRSAAISKSNRRVRYVWSIGCVKDEWSLGVGGANASPTLRKHKCNLSLATYNTIHQPGINPGVLSVWHCRRHCCVPSCKQYSERYITALVTVDNPIQTLFTCFLLFLGHCLFFYFPVRTWQKLKQKYKSWCHKMDVTTVHM